MLQHSFQHSDRLQEALKTKWIKRLSGFYRCSTDEKGYFANLEWDGTNFHYLECACNLYAVLLRDDAGMMFLTSDRRGMLFNEMSNELEQLTASSSQRMLSHHNTSRNVFRNAGCLVTMSREFFTLLGKIVCIPGSRKLLDHTNIFDHLSKLGQYQSLDYLSRLVLTALSFSDNGILSKHLFYLWSGTCSAELRMYFHSLLRFMQYAPKCASNKWFVEAIVNQLLLDDSDAVLIAALNEAIQDKNNLKVVLSKKPNYFGSPDLKDILIRFAAVSEGLSFLKTNNWLENSIDEWKNTGSKEYVVSVEERLSKSLFAPESFVLSRLPSNISPIPVCLPVYMQLSKVNMLTSSSVESKSTKTHNKGYEGFTPDLHGILRIPWHIEVKLSSQPNDNLNHSEYLKLDTFPGC
jgi:rapamycin-insensitive companion of mTOR